jgi:coniferyl-aldehyde dehydrogenase
MNETFRAQRGARERFLGATTSGGVTTNDVCRHVAQDNRPFGGVGPSGRGACHGEHGFRTFSHEKAVLHQAALNGFKLFRPPYGRVFHQLIRRLKRFF